MWNALRLLATFLCAQVCLGQISYRVVRTDYQDDSYGNFPQSADYGETEQQASAASNTGHYEYNFGQEVALPEKHEVDLFTCILIVTISFSTPKSGLQEGDVFSTTTRIATVITIVDSVEGPTDYATTIGVEPNGKAIVRLDLTSFSQINPDSSGLCDSCSLTVVAGACLSGDCGDYNMAATNENLEVQSAVCGDPYTVGLLGQKMDWVGEDGGWYCLVSDGEEFQLNVRVTAPMPDEFPGRQFVSGVRLLLANGHTLGMEVKNPYAIETDGCAADINSRCREDGALRILVDNEEITDLRIPAEKNMHVSATNLPGECRPLGEDFIWEAQFEKTPGRRSLHAMSSAFDEWILEPDTLDSPTWCAKYLEDGVADRLATKSNRSTFRIQTPTANLRINIGEAHQDSVTADDGRPVVPDPELEFWQTDIGVEWHLFSNTVGGMLGETARFFLDNGGMPMAEGHDAIGGPVESYRVAGALGVKFEQLHHK